MKFYLTAVIVLVCSHAISAKNILNNPSFNRKWFGGVKPSPHVVGGTEVKPHSHPYAVSLRIYSATVDDEEQDFQCGGALIAPRWIISAAHCARNQSYFYSHDITAYMGVHNLRKGERTKQVKNIVEVIFHPKWEFRYNTQYDIALMRLGLDIKFNEYVQPIRLPSLSQVSNSFWRETATMVGWGRIGDHMDPSPVLLSVEAKVVSNFYCGFKHSFVLINSGHICADGSNKKGTCNGDSGGPMVITEEDGQGTLIGITSFGTPLGCERSYPTVFTRVTSYLEWISVNTGIPLRQ